MLKPPSTASRPNRLDLKIPDGCPLCAGPVSLRITEHSARAVCVACEFVSAPDVHPTRPGHYELEYPASAEA